MSAKYLAIATWDEWQGNLNLSIRICIVEGSEELYLLLVLLFLAGFVDSIAGGGGLISLPSFMAVGLPAQLALGTNKMQSVPGTLVSAFRFVKKGHVNWKIAIFAFVGAMIGSVIGARTIMLVSDRVIRYIMLIVVPAVAIFTFTRKTPKDEGEAHGKVSQDDKGAVDDKVALDDKGAVECKATPDSRVTIDNEVAPVDYGEPDRRGISDNKLVPDNKGVPDNRVVPYSIVSGLVIGFYDGLLGPGTGTFLILIFTGLLKLDMLTACGNAKIVNAASNVTALATFALSGSVLYSIAIPGAICNILGNIIGSELAMRNGAKIVRPMMLVVMCLLLIKIVLDLMGFKI